MLRNPSGICAGLVFGLALLTSPNGLTLQVGAANAQTATKPASCSSSAGQQMITQVVAAVPGRVLNTFICLGDLDGTGKQQVVVGHHVVSSSGVVSGKATIITNAGVVRKTINF